MLNLWVEKVPGVYVHVVPEVLLEAVVVIARPNILLKDKVNVELKVPLNDVIQRGVIVFLAQLLKRLYVQ